MSETRTLRGVCAYGQATETLNLGKPLLAVTTVKVDGVEVTDYTLNPRERCWPNGPYTWLERIAGWGSLVEITGQWGYYDELASLGVNASQLINATTLVLTAGNLVSPGMVLQVEDEQQLVTAGNGGYTSPSPTLATSQLAAALDANDEEVLVDDGTEFTEGEVLQIGVEDIQIRKIGGNTLVGSRGWNVTNKVAHLVDSPISVYRTYTVQRAVNGTSAAAHTAADLQRRLPPADVHWLALQIAALMRQKALTAFGGRAGNPDAGETFYINEFPRQIADIQKNYSIPYL
jgi:hypothetical protein